MAELKKPDLVVHLTKAEFDALPEYSASLPTGTTIGKKWKRNNFAHHLGLMRIDVLGLTFLFPSPADWWMGEYYDIDDPKKVGIRWSKILSGYDQEVFDQKWADRMRRFIAREDPLMFEKIYGRDVSEADRAYSA
jgi:hypothetical protein